MDDLTENQFYLEFDPAAALTGKLGWRVKDRNTSWPNTTEVVAYCVGEREANTVVDALNFAAAPHNYGFELSKQREESNADG